MKILDGYIIRLFLLNLLILFVVITGLILLINLIVNFDTFVNAAAQEGGSGPYRVGRVIVLAADFYGPQIFLYYNYMVGVLPVGAAAFTFTQLVRNHELTAMLAGGISMQRLAMPVLALGFATNVLMVLNQELVLPNLAEKLQRRHADIRHGGIRDLAVHFMPDSYGSLYTADGFEVSTQTLRDVTILVREPVDETGERFGWASRRITAERAEWDEERDGWRLINGIAVLREPSGTAAGSAGSAAIQAVADDRRLKGADGGADGELGGDLQVRRRQAVDFIASDLDPVSIVQRERQRFRQLLSTQQLNELMERSAILDPAELQRVKHSRLSLVVVNMLILAMGLPFFMLRSPGNMLMQTVKAAPLCIGAWGAGFMLMQIQPGGLPPIAVAWLPVALYAPMAVYLMDSIET